MVFILNRKRDAESLEAAKSEQFDCFCLNVAGNYFKSCSFSLVTGTVWAFTLLIACLSRSKLKFQRVNFEQFTSSTRFNHWVIFIFIVHLSRQEANFSCNLNDTRLNKVNWLSNLSLHTNNRILGNFVTFCACPKENKFVLCQFLSERKLREVSHSSVQFALVDPADSFVVTWFVHRQEDHRVVTFTNVVATDGCS